MFSAILRKELRQQQPVAAAGLVVAVLVGIGLLLASRGVFRSGSISAADAFREFFPSALLWVLWPLWGVLAAIQAFASDRAAGTEAFLLERPVPPRGLFLARLLAAAIGLLELAAGSLLVLWVFSGPVSGVALLPASEQMELLAWAGLPAAFAALASGLLAAALGLPPLAAILAGIILLLGVGLLGFAILAQLPYFVMAVAWVALWPAVALALGYLAAAWRMLTRGEPHGRGRLARGTVVLAAVAVASAVVFVATTPALIRAGTPTTEGWFYWMPRQTNGTAALALYSDAVALLETRTARILRLVPAPSHMLDWSPDGRVLAVASRATRLGGIVDRAEVLWLGPDGREVAPPTRFPSSSEVWFSVAGVWGRDELFVRDGSNRLFRARPGEAAPRLVGSLRQRESLGGVVCDGTLLLWSRRERPGTAEEVETYDLFRLDPATGTRTLEVSSRGDWYALTAGLSDDGRYVQIPEPERPDLVRLRDLERHEDVVVALPGATRARAVWTGSRLLVRADRADAVSLYEIVPRAEPQLIDTWGAGTRLRLAPTGDAALVFDDRERAPYLRRFTDGSEVELAVPVGDRADEDRLEWGWAAPDTLFFDGAQALYLVNARDPGVAPRLRVR